MAKHVLRNGQAVRSPYPARTYVLNSGTRPSLPFRKDDVASVQNPAAGRIEHLALITHAAVILCIILSISLPKR